MQYHNLCQIHDIRGGAIATEACECSNNYVYNSVYDTAGNSMPNTLLKETEIENKAALGA